MAVLGKRKAPDPSVSEHDAEDIFRRHFEAQFAPIDAAAPTKAAAEVGSDEEEEEEEDAEWGGLSDEDDDDDGIEDEEEEDEDTDDADGRGGSVAVEVVDYSKSQIPKPVAMSKRELKAFMSSRIPDQTITSSTPTTTATPSSATASKALPEDAPSLLAQDLELRRLISESHLLSSAVRKSSGANASSSNLLADAEPKPFASGRIRRKATDMRVQALGSKESILTQKNMPMSIRKGILASNAAKETKRRREARENGVILEREGGGTGKKRKSNKSNGMAVDMPGMGRFRGAELKLNDRDVKQIEGSRDVFGRKGGGRRR